MKIYVASSWRNEEQPEIVGLLRDLGHEVYDFKNPPNRSGFGWEQTWTGRPDKPSTLLKTLADPIAIAGFKEDMGALERCDACVLVMPAGISANMEFGWAKGAAKIAVAYIPDAPYANGRSFEPELMWLMGTKIFTERGDLLRFFSTPSNHS